MGSDRFGVISRGCGAKYDADNRLTNRWSAAVGDTYYSYDAVGNLTNIDYPSSSDVAFAYDALSRMTNMGWTDWAPRNTLTQQQGSF
jgi:YD repeat-containing protein